MGAYHGGLGAFTLAARSLRSAGEARKTLRHKILGLYGLNTFTPADKKALLDEIIGQLKRALQLVRNWKSVKTGFAAPRIASENSQPLAG